MSEKPKFKAAQEMQKRSAKSRWSKFTPAQKSQIMKELRSRRKYQSKRKGVK